MLFTFICAYLFSNRMTPRIENIASKEINQFIQILINHTSFTQKIDTHKLYKKENNSISFQMNYINDIASNYINNLEETLLKLEEGFTKKTIILHTIKTLKNQSTKRYCCTYTYRFSYQ